MLPRTFILLFLTSQLATAKLQWPFFERSVNLTIGTPAVQLEIGIYRWAPGDPINSNLTILTAPGQPGGQYDPDTSSTFHGRGKADNGLLGTETFVINGATFTNVPFATAYYNGNELGIGHATDASHESFLGAIVKTMEEPVLVFTFDEINDDNSAHRGTMTLGGRPDVCSTQWNRFKEVQYPSLFDQSDQWAIKLDRITSGKYSFSDPGYLILWFMEDFFMMPDEMVGQIQKGVGALADGSMDCNTKTKIVFTVGALDIEIGPEIYMLKNSDGCRFRISQSGDKNTYYLPPAVLKNRCLLLDFEKFEVGIAQRV